MKIDKHGEVVLKEDHENDRIFDALIEDWDIDLEGGDLRDFIEFVANKMKRTADEWIKKYGHP